jgi:hypothetical protein
MASINDFLKENLDTVLDYIPLNDKEEMIRAVVALNIYFSNANDNEPLVSKERTTNESVSKERSNAIANEPSVSNERSNANDSEPSTDANVRVSTSEQSVQYANAQSNANANEPSSAISCDQSNSNDEQSDEPSNTYARIPTTNE